MIGFHDWDDPIDIHVGHGSTSHGAPVKRKVSKASHPIRHITYQQRKKMMKRT